MKQPTKLSAKKWVCSALLMTSWGYAAELDADPYMWLEEVGSQASLQWVRAQNAVSSKELEAQPGFESMQSRLLSILESADRIPSIVKIGPHFYNYWRDTTHVRGIWRRTTLDEFRKASPSWEVVIDLDSLAESEKENWVWARADCVRPSFDRCLVYLSRGGGDAQVIREFDLKTKRFVVGGFEIAEAKQRVEWRNHDELFVGTNFGPGSLTDSGYPRFVKSWKRGTPLSSAKTIFEGERTDVLVIGFVDEHPGSKREIILRRINSFSSERFVLAGTRLTKLPLPKSVETDTFRDQVLVNLRDDWTVGGKTYPAGALIAISWSDLLADRHNYQALYEPNSRGSLVEVRATKNYLLVNELDNVQSKLYSMQLSNGRWVRRPVSVPIDGDLLASPVDEFDSDDYFLSVTDFVVPNSLYYGSVGKTGFELLKRLPAYFNADGLEVTRHESRSKDGTRVHYFQVAKHGLKLDGSNPTLLWGYGGFENTYLPTYNGALGSAWLERGGVYVLANIRGGGEFGPKWHQAAIKDNRQRAYDDFISVAEDLIARKVTSTPHLGIMGRSNGGLLMGVMLTQRPDLFGAVVCEVPLLDMRRYHKLLAGQSWMAEYGDPDKPEEWAYIGKYSPYQNVRKDVKYPRVLFTTSTRDDRVHPGHARKMAAKMLEQGHDILYYENVEGGHGGVANFPQQAHMNALTYTFLWKQLATR